MIMSHKNRIEPTAWIEEDELEALEDGCGAAIVRPEESRSAAIPLYRQQLNVPYEPTKEMVKAAHKVHDKKNYAITYQQIYKAMVKAFIDGGEK